LASGEANYENNGTANAGDLLNIPDGAQINLLAQESCSLIEIKVVIDVNEEAIEDQLLSKNN
jgi:hypothetical protein